MANHSRMIKKLQTALISADAIVKVNTRQFFSEDQERMITCYSVVTPVWSEKKRKMIDREQLSTCSAVEVVKFLAKMLEGLRNGAES